MDESQRGGGVNEAGRAYVARLEQAAGHICARVGLVPQVLIVLGSGLGTLTEIVEARIVLPYTEIPGMPVVRTDGHAGNLIVGKLGGREVAIFQGRVHCHDGLPPAEVAFGVRAMVHLGVRTLLVTNAAGGIREGMQPGDLMVIDNHISLFLPQDPSYGLEHPMLGAKFYPQTDPYDTQLGDAFCAAAARRGWGAACHRGVYCFLPGPRYESRADIQLLRLLRAADAVGMSTVPEVLAALQMSGGSLRVLGISTITNIAAGVSAAEPNHDEVTTTGAAAAPRLRALVADVVEGLPG